MSVAAYLEQRRREAALLEALQKRKDDPARLDTRYKRLGEYDAVLRAHCRLDEEPESPWGGDARVEGV
jgi:hypothetical protein